MDHENQASIVIAATGEELDGLVEQYVVQRDIPSHLWPRWSSDPAWTRGVKGNIASRDLGPAFARELARIVIRDKEWACLMLDHGSLWALLSATPEQICRAAVLAAIKEDAQ